jgi:hypothetical protein
MKKLGVAALVLVLAGGVGSVRADLVPISVGGGWQLFWWHGAPGASGVWNDDGISVPYKYIDFTFTDLGWTSLKVTDYLVAGDEFKVYDGGGSIFLGTTSVPPDWVYHHIEWTDNIDAAYTDLGQFWSHGEFLLGPGSHSIAVLTIVTPPLTAPGWARNVDGTGALRVDAVGDHVSVPVPAAVALAALGLGLSGWLARRWAV